MEVEVREVMEVMVQLLDQQLPEVNIHPRTGYTTTSLKMSPKVKEDRHSELEQTLCKTN